MMLLLYVLLVICCFVKQKTAYEMRISDWSSDVCSSDLIGHGRSFRGGIISTPMRRVSSHPPARWRAPAGLSVAARRSPARYGGRDRRVNKRKSITPLLREGLYHQPTQPHYSDADNKVADAELAPPALDNQTPACRSISHTN